MALNSVSFICCFLPLLLVLYRLIRSARARNALLLAASLLFYACGSLTGLLLLLAAWICNYGFGLVLMCGKRHRALLGVFVGANLVFLGAFKYLDFLFAQFTGLIGTDWTGLGIAAPIGISFFTFKCISYLVDTARDPAAGTRSAGELLLYISFFPQILSGPITRFGDFAQQLAGRLDELSLLSDGICRFVLGLGKKLVLASAAAAAADAVFAQNAALSLPLGWLGAVGYTLQIYFDFSGYSDMAIGVGQMFGFSTGENFQHPYVADSITDFWRRWHISLSAWFRDYLYIPLGGSRRGKLRTALNKFIVFALCGLWHGAAWTFVFWGVWHGIFSALESAQIIPTVRLQRSRIGRAMCHIYTLLVVCLGFVIFRADSLQNAWQVLSAMFGAVPASSASAVALRRLLSGRNVVILIVGAVCCFPLGERIKARFGEFPRALRYGACLCLLVVCLLELAAGGFAPFIYFQF